MGHRCESLLVGSFAMTAFLRWTRIVTARSVAKSSSTAGGSDRRRRRFLLRSTAIKMEERATKSTRIHFRRPFSIPLNGFETADTDLDARLNDDELNAAVESGRQHLVVSTMRSFDDDNDRELSLSEYRSSMLGNYNYPWDHRPLDQDRDGRLSYVEFVFDEVDLFQLQRWYYFHRLDLDRDGGLSLDEFDFRPLAPLSIRAYSTDSDESKLIYQDDAISRLRLAQRFTRWDTGAAASSVRQGGQSEGRIVSVSLEDNHARTICRGIQPSWSADGDSFVCERRSEGAGIWILDAGGLRGRRVAAGHGPKWSPDGKSIAFLQDNGVSIFDVQTGEIRPILLREDHPYQDLGSDIAWSPDSRRLAVLGNFAATSQLLILPVTRPDETGKIRIRYSFNVGCRGNLNWTRRDGITVGIRDADTRETRIDSLIPDSDQEPKRVTDFAGLSAFARLALPRTANGISRCPGGVSLERSDASRGCLDVFWDGCRTIGRPRVGMLGLCLSSKFSLLIRINRKAAW